MYCWKRPFTTITKIRYQPKAGENVMNSVLSKSWIFAAPLAMALMACNTKQVGFVDTGRMVNEAIRFQIARDSLKNFEASWRKEAGGLDSALKELATAIGTQGSKGPKGDSLVSQYNTRQRDLQRYVQASAEKAKTLEVQLMSPHLKTTNQCLQKFIAEYKIPLLLGTQQAGTILAAAPEQDYTSKVIEYLNTKCKE